MAILNAEIIAIGNEILSGISSNTNAAEISQGLLQIGIIPARHLVLPDDPVVLKRELAKALERSTLVICTGGLGPTVDDLTRQVAAELFNSEFKLDPLIAEELKQRYGSQLLSLENQATVPVKAKIIKNSVGTAPGFMFQENGKTLILLPGVPQEMRRMLADQVLPNLKGSISATQRLLRLTLNLFELPESAVDPTLRELQAQYPAVSMGIYPNHGILQVTMTTEGGQHDKADTLLSAAMNLLRHKFKENIFESPSGKIEEAVHLRLMDSGSTLSLAESCTGGAMAARLIRYPGASTYMIGSVVAYSNGMKESVLRVPKEIIQEHGAISSEAVESMLNGIFSLTGSDYAVAVSGIAGPSGGTLDKPVGTIWCGVAKKDESLYTWKIQARGSREMIIERSINAILSKLYKVLKEG